MFKRLLAAALVIILSLPSNVVYAVTDNSSDLIAPTVSALGGKVQIRRGGGQREFTMYKGMEILSGDTITTGVNSTVTITYGKKEVIIGSCSIIYVNEIWERHERDISAFTVIEGSVKNKVDKHLTGNSRNTIQTANAIAGVRGTEFVMGYSRNVQAGAFTEGNPFTVIAVFDGTVRLDVNKAPTSDAGENSGIQENDSFLVQNGGTTQLHESIVPKTTETIAEAKPFEMKLENIDVKILEAIAQDSNAVQSNPVFFRELSATLAEKQETAKEMEQFVSRNEAAAPQSFTIYASNADEVIPNLPEIMAEMQTSPSVASSADTTIADAAIPADAIALPAQANTEPTTEPIADATPVSTAEAMALAPAEPTVIGIPAPEPIAPTPEAVAAVAPTPESAAAPSAVSTPEATQAPAASTPEATPAPTAASTPEPESTPTTEQESTPSPTSSPKTTIAQASLTISSTHEYTGQEQTPVFTVTNGTRTLVNNVDYKFTLANNIAAGTATITLNGIGNYEGTATHTFTISKANQAALNIGSVGSLVYGDAPVTMAATGGNGTGTVTWAVTNGNAVTISASTGVFVINMAGAVTITVTKAEDNNYKAATNSITFNVNKRDIANVSVSVPALSYNGLAQTPAPNVSDGSDNLISAGDYTVSYADNINAGIASVTLTASESGNYTGIKTVNFAIGKAALTVTADNKSVSFGGEVPVYTASYNGFVNGENNSALQGALVFDCDYDPSSAAGTYDITPSGLTSNNYDMEFVEGTLSASGKSLSSAIITVTSTHAYTGLAQVPVFTVSVGGDPLIKDTDFSAEYSNNTNAGTATITITGTSNYSGTATKEFTIEKANQVGFAINSPESITYGDSPVQLTASGGNSAGLVTWAVTNGGAVVIAQDTGVISIEKAGEVTVTATKAPDANYNTVSDSITFTVGKRDLSGVTVTAETLIYTGVAQTPAPVVTDGDNNLTSIDDFEVSSYADNTAAGTATVTITAKAGGNYTGTATGNFIIGKAPLIVAVISDSIAYGAAAPAFSSSFAGFVNGENETVVSGSPVYSCNYTPSSPVGNYDVHVSIGTLSSANYEFTQFVSGTLSVGLGAQNTLILKTTDNLISYPYKTTGITLTTTGGSGNGAVTYAVTGGNGAVSVGESSGIVTVHSLGESTITATKAGDSSYAVAIATLDITITPKDISGASISINSVTYDGTEHSPFVTATDGDALTSGSDYEIIFTPVTSAGEHIVTINGKGNYGGSTTPVFTINKADLTVAANDASVVYGGTPNYNVTYSGFKETDDESVVTGALSYDSQYTAESSVGDYTVTPIVTGLSAANYKFVPASGTLTVTQAYINGADVSISGSYIYNGESQTSSPTVTLYAKTLTADDYTASYSNNLNAGSASITITGKGNYQGTAAGSFTIDKAVLTVTADNKTITYRDNSPIYTYTYSGFMIDDTESVVSGTPTASSSYTSTSNVGDYGITPDISSISAANYSFIAVNGTLTVNAMSISNAIVSFSGGYIYTGTEQEPGSIVTVSGATLADGTDYTAAYTDNINVGTASVTITGTGNYTGTANGSFQITTANLTVTAEDKSIIYRDAIPAYTVNYDGFVSGESASVLSGMLSYACDHTPASAKGEYSITPSGLSSDNYSITFAPGALTVNAKALSSAETVIAVSSNHTYSGSVQTPTYTAQDSGVTLVASSDFTAGYTNNTNAGTATITLTGIGNYTGNATQNFEIAKAEQAVLTSTNLLGYNYGDTGFQLEVSGGSGTGSLSYSADMSNVIAVSTSGYVTINNAGTTTVKVTKAEDTNYLEESVDIPLTIAKRNLSTITASIANVTYNGSEQKPVITFTDMLDADNLAKGNDFIASYSSNINAGTATVTLTATESGNYSGTKAETFTIDPATLTVTVAEELSPINPIVISLPNEITSLVACDNDAFEVNGATLTYNGETAFPDGEITVKFTTDNTNYILSAAITIRDGQDSTSERQIPVKQSNIEEFIAYADTTDGLTRHYLQTEPITLNVVSNEQNNWVPIGDFDRQFTGSYDGGGNSISNIFINIDDWDIGIFGTIGAEGIVKDLVLTDVTINGYSCVGAITGENYGTIIGCSVTGNISGSNDSDAYYTGGITGYNEGTLQDSTFGGTVTGGGNVGGIVGESSAPITDCEVVNGTISGSGSSTGGIVGYSTGNIESCSFSGSVTGNYFVGGIAGGANCDVYNSTFSGVVTGNFCTGGIAGYVYGTISGCNASGDIEGLQYGIAGGISGTIGLSDYHCGKIENSHFTGGTVTGTESTGGIAGEAYGDISNCTAAGSVTSGSHAGGIVGQTQSVNIEYCSSSCDVKADNYVGGIAGYSYSTITNCSASGTVMGSDTLWAGPVGGLVGGNTSIIRQSVFFGETVSGMDNLGGVVGDNKGTIENCVALNTSIKSFTSSATPNVGRITGANYNTLSGNYARMDMLINDSAASASGSANIHGDSIAFEHWSDADWWTATAGFTDTWWDGKLPLTLPGAAGMRMSMVDITITASEGGLISLDGETWESEITTMMFTGFNLVAMSAPDEGYVFSGWYDEFGNLISYDEEYAFTPMENIVLSAMFEPLPGNDNIQNDTPYAPPADEESEPPLEPQETDMVEPPEDEDDTEPSPNDNEPDDSSESPEGGETENSPDDSTDNE